MLYAGSSTLTGLGFVVMDEVHYLADRSRGAVWEEVIIHLPESVALVSLSATVSNAEEFGEWLSTVRGQVDDRRGAPSGAALPARHGRNRSCSTCSPTDRREPQPPVGSARRASTGQPRARCGSPATTGRANRLRDRRSRRGDSVPTGSAGGAAASWTRAGSTWSSSSTRGRCCPPSCSSSAAPAATPPSSSALSRNLRLTTPEERDEILDLRRGAGARTSPDEDLEVLGYPSSSTALSRGVAAHHAGMLPAFKECVEQLFSRGLCKVVFATETLALGINMPARSVVIERLSKWNGETHADITPGEYTQLTGRAGRRGIDVEGHAVVVWAAGHRPEGGRRSRLHPDLSAALVVPAVVQHGGQPRAHRSAGSGPRAAGVVVRAVPGGQGRRRPGAAAAPS